MWPLPIGRGYIQVKSIKGGVLIMISDDNRKQLMFMVFDENFYETPEQYNPSVELLEIVRKQIPLDWKFIKKNVWFHLYPEKAKLPFQGWKIHLSTIPSECKELLGIVTDKCITHKVAFKFLVDKNMLLFMSDKNQDRAASGKYITIYPETEKQCHLLLEDLYKETEDFKGPYILSDRRYKDSTVLHYRYGSIRPLNKLNIYGQQDSLLADSNGKYILENRVPFWNPPNWVDDPFFQESVDNQDDGSSISLNNGQYTIKEAFGFSTTGGVYLAIDNSSEKLVVIKEARPYTMVDNNGLDAIERLKREYEILTKIRSHKVPEALDLFFEWEHLFLVEEYARGGDLINIITSSNPLLKTELNEKVFKEYVDLVQKIWLDIALEIKSIHNKGVILGDISSNNVIIDDENNVKLIDFESAWEINKGKPTQIVTPGFSTGVVDGNVGQENDIYSFGALMLSTLFPINAILDIKKDAYKTFSKFLCNELHICNNIQSVIERCMNITPGRRPNIDEVINSLKGNSIYSPKTFITKYHSESKSSLLVDRTMNYIKKNATLQRRDRLFPSDPKIYETNPLSVAYGAAGVSYAYYKIKGDVPKSWLYWILSKDIHPSTYTPGLYVGAAGISWVLWEMGFKDISLQLMDGFENHPLINESPDIFYGMSGYGLGCLRLYIGTKDSKWLDKAYNIGRKLMKTKQSDSLNTAYWVNNSGNIYIGYANGASGIALFLLYLGIISGEETFIKTGNEALNFDISQMITVEGDNLSVPAGVANSDTEVITHYWYSGSVGVGTTLLRYWYYTKKDVYMETLNRLLPDTYKKITASPGLFNGVSGLGNFLLDAYVFTGEHNYLEKAYNIANGLEQFKIDTHDGVGFPGDKTLRLSTDFGTGSAGISMFLNRLSNPTINNGNFNFTLDQVFL